MKLLREKIILNQPGTVTLIPEQPDDLWLLYNLITAGDVITAVTSRKLNSDSTNKKVTTRVKLELEIKITDVIYDKSSSVLRVRGRTLTSNEHVKSGLFHTLELEENKEFNLDKDVWNEETIKTLKAGLNKRAAEADLAIIQINEGSAKIFLVGKSATTICSTIVGEKLKNKSGSKRFFDNIFASYTKHINMDVVKCVVIASIDSSNEEFRCHLLQEAAKLKIKSIESNKSRIVLVNKTNVKEILQDKAVMSMMNEATKGTIETKVLEEVMDLITNDSDCVCYGTKSVELAHELMAIETLLITEDMLKNRDIVMRKKYLKLVKSVKESGGNVVQFTSLHEDSSKKLAQLTGIAAILRFPIPNIEELIL